MKPVKNIPHNVYDPWQHCYGSDLSDNDDDEIVELRVTTWKGIDVIYQMTVDEWDELKRSQSATYYCTTCNILTDSEIKEWMVDYRKCPSCHDRIDAPVRSITLASDDSYPL